MPLDSARTWRLFYAEAYCQLMQQVRVTVQFIVMTFGTLLGYVGWALVFGLFMREAVQFGPFLVVLVGALNTLSLGLVQMGGTTANDRSMSWMRLRRASAMRPAVYFAAKLAVTLLQAIPFALLLPIAATLFGHMQLPLDQWVPLFLLFTLGVLPLAALGLALAYVGGPQTAMVVLNYTNLILLGLVAALWVDLHGTLTIVLQVVNQLSPVYHFAVLIVHAFGFTGLPALQGGPTWLHLLALTGLTALFLTLAVLLYRRDEGKTYG